MSFAIFKGDKSMKDLVTRLFGISGKGSQAKVDAASKALLQANPQLSDLSKVPVGSVINVPATAPPLIASEEAPATVVDRAAIAGVAQQTLTAINQRLSELDARATDCANAFLAAVQPGQIPDFLQNSPLFKDQLPDLIAATQAQVGGAKTNQAARAQAVTGVQAKVSAFALGTPVKR